MGEVYKTAKFKLRISNRKKRFLKTILTVYSGDISKVLSSLERNRDTDETKIVVFDEKSQITQIDEKQLSLIVNDAVEKINYPRMYQEKLRLTTTYILSSYYNLKINDFTPGFPSKPPVENKKQKQIIIEQYYKELAATGFTDDGIDPAAHEKEVDLAGKISRLTRNKLHPFPFVRASQFTIIEKPKVGGAPLRIALLDNLLQMKDGKNHINKFLNGDKSHFEGIVTGSNQMFSKKSSALLPCVLEWSKFHELNFFRTGTPKTAQLVYNNEDDSFYLHVAFRFIPHIDENKKLTYLKTQFDEKATRLAEEKLEKGKKKKIYKVADAYTGEILDIEAYNKTVNNSLRETDAFIGVDMGMALKAAFAVVKNGKVLYRGYGEAESLTRKLNVIYDEIASLQANFKQNRKRINELWRKIKYLTRNDLSSTANKIIWAAEYYNALLVLENLAGLKKKSRRTQHYGALAEILSYKAQIKGFKLYRNNPPKAYMEVRPWLTSKTCSKCGYAHPGNRDIKQSQDKFKCLLCGFENNADINAAINIARFGEYYSSFREKFETLDDYMKNIAGCLNCNFSEYRKLIYINKIIKLIPGEKVL